MWNVEIHVGLGESDVGRIEHPRHRPLHQAERVDVRDQVAAVRVELDEARDGGLLLAVRTSVRLAVAAGVTAAAVLVPDLPAPGSLWARAAPPNWPKKSRHSWLTLAGSER